MKITLSRIVLLTAVVLTTACGMEPSGGREKSAVKPTLETSSDERGPTETQENPIRESSDALRTGVAQLPASYGAINTVEVSACHSIGKVFNRRTLKCSNTISLATTFECNKSGISDGFKDTGYQIDIVLSSAESDGFMIDQCGESGDGTRMVFFVRADDDGTYSVREIAPSI